MKLEGNGGITVNGSQRDFLISKDDTGDDLIPGLDITQEDPFLGIGFYSYAAGQTVIINKGHVWVHFPATDGGGFSILDGGIDLKTFTDLTPGTSGYIVWKYGQVLQEMGVSSFTSDGDVDFGDPSTNYGVTETVITDATGGETNEVNNARYGYVFVTERPAPSRRFFQQIICEVDVNTFGFTTVRPVHVGVINVSLGMTGKTIQFVASPND